MKRATLKDHLRYRFDNFMARGTIALVGALFAVTFLLIVTATLIVVLARLHPEGSTAAMGFAEALWQVTMRTIDTGTVAGDSGWSYRIVGFLITLSGIFLVSALIGIIASGLDNRIDELRRGRSQVIETGHTVILGWSPQVFSIVAELALANRHLRDDRARVRRDAAPAWQSSPIKTRSRWRRRFAPRYPTRWAHGSCAGAATRLTWMICRL